MTTVLQVENIIEEKEVHKQGFSQLHDIPGDNNDARAANDRCSSQLVFKMLKGDSYLFS